MRKILFLVLMLGSIQAFGYGLGFCDSSHPIDERTAYDVYAESSPSFRNRFTMYFNLAIMPPVEIGYIFRLKADRNNNELVYNLFFNVDADGNYRFRFNQEGKTVLISLTVGAVSLKRDHWFPVGLEIDMADSEISLSVGGRRKSCHVEGLPEELRPQITFGRSDYFIDVPTMSIDNLRIGGDSPMTVPFNEDVGNSVSDSSGHSVGSVQNPIWLVNSAYRWNCEAKMASSSRAGCTYDMDKHQFYYFNKDTLKTYSPSRKSMTVTPFVEPCPVPLFLANSFVQPGKNRMYVFEVYPENYRPGPMVASVDLDYLDWRIDDVPPLKMQLHHHGAMINPKGDGILFFGGFGNLYFSNKLYSYVADSGRFEVADSLQGDVISPRYFTAIGYDPGTRFAYIFGGMGNESGEQIVGRRYFYDLFRLNLSTGEVKKLWELPSQSENTVPARGLEVDGDNHFFVLRYPESKSSSFLKLYRFSMDDGTYTVLGDSIPIKSDKITTNAHLWFDRSDGKFYVSVQETDDDISSTLKIYSLSYPAVNEATFKTLGSRSIKNWAWFVILPLVLFAGGLLFMYWKFNRRKKTVILTAQTGSTLKKQEEAPAMEHVRPNSLYLFGNFEAVNSSGRKIGYLFTSRLRAILFLILQYNNEDEGISSGTLGSLIWPDKPKDKVKNSRGVAINGLRKILSDFKDISIVNVDSHFRIETGPDLYCDYLRVAQLISSDEILSQNRREFLDILGRGKFLKDFEDPAVDDFKRMVELRLENAILKQINITFETGFYRECIRLVDAEFNIDPLNEQALRMGIYSMLYLGEEKSARAFYRRYAEEYLKTSGEKLPTSYEVFVSNA